MLNCYSVEYFQNSLSRDFRCLWWRASSFWEWTDEPNVEKEINDGLEPQLKYICLEVPIFNRQNKQAICVKLKEHRVKGKNWLNELKSIVKAEESL